MRFRTAEKLQCAERELKRRMRTYPTKVANHRMTKLEAEREIDLMADIALDIAEQLEAERERRRVVGSI